MESRITAQGNQQLLIEEEWYNVEDYTEAAFYLHHIGLGALNGLKTCTAIVGALMIVSAIPLCIKDVLLPFVQFTIGFMGRLIWEII